MTVELPKFGFVDRLLLLLGKRRAVWVPDVAEQVYGRAVYAKARKESVWRTLTRKKNAPLSQGWMYLDAPVSEERE